MGPAVRTENLIRIDCVTESPNVSGDDRSVLPLPDPVRLAVQVEEPLRPRQPKRAQIPTRAIRFSRGHLRRLWKEQDTA
jgi:hypothetical protein